MLTFCVCRLQAKGRWATCSERRGRPRPPSLDDSLQPDRCHCYRANLSTTRHAHAHRCIDHIVPNATVLPLSRYLTLIFIDITTTE